MAELSETVQSVKQATRTLADPNRFIRLNQFLKSWCAIITETRLPFSDFSPFDCLPKFETQKISGSRSIKGKRNFNQQKQHAGSNINLEETASSRQLTGLTAKIKAGIAKIQPRTQTRSQIQGLQQIVSDAQIINMLNGLTVRETCRQIFDSSYIIDNALKYNKAEDGKNRDNQIAASLPRKTRNPDSKRYYDVGKIKSKTNMFMGTNFKKPDLLSDLPLNQSLERMDTLTNNILDNYKKAEQNNSCAEQKEFSKYSAGNLLRNEFAEKPEAYEAYPEEVKENFRLTNNKSSIIQKQDSSGRHEKTIYTSSTDQETAAALVNRALIKQAKRHGVDLS